MNSTFMLEEVLLDDVKLVKTTYYWSYCTILADVLLPWGLFTCITYVTYSMQ